MKTKKTTLLVFLLLGASITSIYAQQTTDASGGNASGSGGTVNYSVGQIVYTTNIGANGSIAQGVQQAYEIFVSTALDDKHNINMSLSAYPNPTNDLLSLKVDQYEEGKLLYQLLDINGKLLEKKNINTMETSITMIHLPQATYFLQVIESNKTIKSFKIIKN